MNKAWVLLTRLLTGLAVGLVAQSVGADTTQLVKPAIPGDARKVTLEASNGALSVKGRPLNLSPSVQIRDQQNRLYLSQSLYGEYKAALALDTNGKVTRIWLQTQGN